MSADSQNLQTKYQKLAAEFAKVSTIIDFLANLCILGMNLQCLCGWCVYVIYIALIYVKVVEVKHFSVD